MKVELAPTTRMAIRAAAVAAAAVLVARLSFLERPYWIVLTAVLLVYESAGESIKRSGQRFVMTTLGCLVGWALYVVAAPVPGLRWTILLGGVFQAVYYRSNPRGVVYAPMIFFVSVYVVFTFAVVDGWTGQLMLTRLYDTALGCLLALFGSLLVLPQHAGLQLEDDLAQFWISCRQYFEKTYTAMTAAGPAPTSAERQALLKQLEQLRTRSRNSEYERFIGRAARQRRLTLVESSEMLCRHLLAFGAVVQAGVPASAVPSLVGTFVSLAARVRSAFDRLSVTSAHASVTVLSETHRTEDVIFEPAMQLLNAGAIDRFEFLQLGPAIYHLGEASKSLEAM